MGNKFRTGASSYSRRTESSALFCSKTVLWWNCGIYFLCHYSRMSQTVRQSMHIRIIPHNVSCDWCIVVQYPFAECWTTCADSTPSSHGRSGTWQNSAQCKCVSAVVKLTSRYYVPPYTWYMAAVHVSSFRVLRLLVLTHTSIFLNPDPQQNSRSTK